MSLKPAQSSVSLSAAGRRPRIVIIGSRGYPSYYGGFETAVRKLAPFLVDRGWDVLVYGRANSTKDDDPMRDTRVRTVVTRGLETKSLSTLTYGASSVLHSVYRAKPDVALVLNVANGYVLPLLRLARIPVLVNVDGIEWERQKWGRLARFVFRTGARFTGWFASQIVVDSREIGRRWSEDFQREGAFIPYGGERTSGSPPPLGLAQSSYALIVARFVPENTVAEFFAAVPSIAERHPVVIVGSSGYGGHFDDEAKRLSKSFSNVTWLGHVNDDTLLFSLLENAGAYFHGHSVGGTNPALVQAIACGAPIVARDTVYNREVLGPAGTFVEPSVEAIASGMIAMLDSRDEQQLSRANSRERSASEYTWESVCSAYEREVRRLLRRQF